MSQGPAFLHFPSGAGQASIDETYKNWAGFLCCFSAEGMRKSWVPRPVCSVSGTHDLRPTIRAPGRESTPICKQLHSVPGQALSVLSADLWSAVVLRTTERYYTSLRSASTAKHSDLLTGLRQSGTSRVTTARARGPGRRRTASRNDLRPTSLPSHCAIPVLRA